MTSCDPSSLCVTLLCSQAKIDVCRHYDLTLAAIFGPGEREYQGAKVPPMVLSFLIGSESTWERKFQLPYNQWSHMFSYTRDPHAKLSIAHDSVKLQCKRTFRGRARHSMVMFVQCGRCAPFEFNYQKWIVTSLGLYTLIWFLSSTVFFLALCPDV